ncbi:MAG TPA: ANTAR domain-containing protein [Acidimicrobiales bacterium]|nr:ANTAR domain-containing protein [Acidimicrobiales bacterium]
MVEDEALTIARLLEEVAGLREALAGRTVISNAVGLLMGNAAITSEEAFDWLRRSSQRRNVKLRVVAAEIVDRHDRRVREERRRQGRPRGVVE